MSGVPDTVPELRQYVLQTVPNDSAASRTTFDPQVKSNVKGQGTGYRLEIAPARVREMFKRKPVQ